MKITGQNASGKDGRMEVEYLQEMLEGQVAVLSAGVLKPKEALDVLRALRESRMYEPRQNSYMLYPNKELPLFEAKNCVPAAETESKEIAAIIKKTGSTVLSQDADGTYHFNGEFRNVRFLKEFCAALPEQQRPDAAELSALEALYENTFRHQSFTGRSGTFYAYEGLGSIYWHMVSKLLLATQENAFAAISSGAPADVVHSLTNAYYDIRAGIGFNKDAEIYGAFPADPYSHTPNMQGSKQPGMTGQVKEEVLTRWGELGMNIVNGCAAFNPKILKNSEFFEDGTLNFTWCGTPVTYILSKDNAAPKITVNKNSRSYDKKAGASLTASETADLFARNGKISNIEVEVSL